MGEPTVRDVLAEALDADPDFDDPNMNNPSAWDLVSDQIAALEAAGFRVIRSDPELAARLREWAGPPYCADDESSAEDMRLAADLIDTDTGRTHG